MEFPNIKLHKLKNDLTKGHIMPVNFLFGEDQFFLREATNLFRIILLKNAFKDLNFSEFFSGEDKPEKIIQTVKTSPFMDICRVVIVNQADRFDAAQWKKFGSYFKSPQTGSYLVFLIAKASLRNISTLKKVGAIIQFSSPNSRELGLWIKFFANKYNKNITSQAVFTLKELFGNNLSIVEQELNKISLFVGDKKNIDSDDINAVSVSTKAESIFSLITKLSKKDKRQSLIMLKRLIAKGVPPLVVLSLIVRQYRLLILIKGKVAEGIPLDTIKADLNIPPFLFNGLYKESSRFSFEELSRIYQIIADTDLLLKTSRIDKEIILETLVFSLCNENN